MLIFWIIIALLVLLALWFVLPPLFATEPPEVDAELQTTNVSIYQNQYKELADDLRNGLIAEDQYQREKEAMERRLLEDVKMAGPKAARNTYSRPSRKLAYSVAAAIPIAAVSFYLAVGNPRAASAPPSSANGTMSAPEQQGTMSQQQIAANVDNLAKRLQQNPNDLQGWLMLGRSYMMLDRMTDAAAAFDRASQLDPTNEDVLMMAGAAHFELKNYQKAIEYWQKLPPQSDNARAVSEQFAQARQLAGSQPSR